MSEHTVTPVNRSSILQAGGKERYKCAESYNFAAHRKPRDAPAPYKRQTKPGPKPGARDVPKTTAKPLTSKKRENLTLHDWMTVFAFIDKHPGLSQDDIVNHFKTRAEGVLKFNQSMLSRKIKDRGKLEARVNTHPNALSSKCPRIVTWPDIERALALWVHHMEEKGETVNGPMLAEKRGRFEEAFGVLKEERLTGDHWVPSFCRACNIKERRRHEEAGLVDLVAIEAERIRVHAILARYPPENI
ncbi:hypothetical protein M422DRAFT_251629 [Sphaerobolus stellatus SS14]|uniref:HTH CENPB-type domain-containing protein n=1 Tax=Sphaerobolus stellatus (strain SS14) TaxID=990650 RepID=A0A0C9W0N2_SPHS4|nr:hypothetical protein M422DRAFT_251629 [Sphaerobolus stellatus SS14]